MQRKNKGASKTKCQTSHFFWKFVFCRFGSDVVSDYIASRFQTDFLPILLLCSCLNITTTWTMPLWPCSFSFSFLSSLGHTHSQAASGHAIPSRITGINHCFPMESERAREREREKSDDACTLLLYYLGYWKLLLHPTCPTYRWKWLSNIYITAYKYLFQTYLFLNYDSTEPNSQICIQLLVQLRVFIIKRLSLYCSTFMSEKKKKKKTCLVSSFAMWR